MPHFRKGSPEAKAYMARLRAMRGKGCRGAGKRSCKGGSLLGILGKAYARTVGKWIKGWREEDVAQRNELKRLRGGKFEPKKDLVDFAAGPLGWIKMAIRKKRQKEIDRLRAQRGGGLANRCLAREIAKPFRDLEKEIKKKKGLAGGSVNEDAEYLTRVLGEPKMQAILQERFKTILRKQK